jgi:hypothetical protein
VTCLWYLCVRTHTHIHTFGIKQLCYTSFFFCRNAKLPLSLSHSAKRGEEIFIFSCHKTKEKERERVRNEATSRSCPTHTHEVTHRGIYYCTNGSLGRHFGIGFLCTTCCYLCHYIISPSLSSFHTFHTHTCSSWSSRIFILPSPTKS